MEVTSSAGSTMQAYLHCNATFDKLHMSALLGLMREFLRQVAFSFAFLCVYQLFYSLSQEANVILKMCPN
jgi:hypothetical protein